MSSSQLNASLLRLKLLDALRSGDNAKVDAIIEQLSNTKSTIQNTDLTLLKQTILHYAVQVAPLPTLQYLVANGEKYNLDINSQDSDGNTPLHLAAMCSRLEIVKYLLSLPQINDTIVNLNKKQPVEVCKDLEIVQVMQYERAKFVEKLAGQLRTYFSNRDFANLDRILEQNPRASELLDINGADPESGNTVLHEFIMKDDLQMCDWILKHGGDPFKRDKHGKLPIDLIHGKNEPLKKLLKVASKDQNIMDPVVSTNSAIKTGGAPTQKGYLRKWTNFASGYKLRYFVLDQGGILSYYTNQDDTNNACRGSLNLGFATLHLDSSEKLKFEIIGKNGMRWHLKANHPIETNRWVWTLQNAITIAKDNIKKRNRAVLASDPPRKSTESQSSVNSKETTDSKRHRFHLRRKHRRNESQNSVNSVGSESFAHEGLTRENTFGTTTAPPNLGKIPETSADHTSVATSPLDSESSFTRDGSAGDNVDYDLDEEGYESDAGSYNEDGKDATSSINGQIYTVKRSLDVEVASLLDLFTQVSKSIPADAGGNEGEICKVGFHTLSVIQDLLGKYSTLILAKEGKMSRKLERQLEVNKLWENSIRQLEDEIRQREAKLAEYDDKKKQLRRYLTQSKSGNATPTLLHHLASSASGTDRSTEAPANLTPVLEDDAVLEDYLNDSEDEFFDADGFGEAGEEEDVPTEPVETQAGPEQKGDVEGVAPGVVPGDVPGEAPGAANESANVPPEQQEKADPQGAAEEHTLVDEKQGAPEGRTYNPAQESINTIIHEEKSYLGYENPPRTKLAMDEDNRPKVGLWGILKSMIGKDMTRMTLPVSFNEPTSLVQRLAEDIEYCQLLDTAAGFDDSTLRLVYVASFAASEYASTIGRIAKPFNPLLGETFEFADPRQNYRLFVEQVSHHPPISACSAQSAKWDYFGENAVDSQFKGRSFDFKHLGKMFCTLRPDNGVIDVKGNKVESELYSWKKVNTSVVGIIVGNPTVDNYGKMEVRNHTTGDCIIVDLKQRGWRASSAYQLSGQSLDAKGTPRWAMGGHWNSKIFAKKINKSTNPENLSEDGKISNDPFSGLKFLVWQVAKRPNVPFNLTAFAVALNGLDDNLSKWIPPTDTRLRPDQRAMENGQYDFAADEKHRVEEKQRRARKEREIKKVEYVPKWFVKGKHPVTGDNYWEFNGDYWKSRRDHKLEGIADIF